MRWSFLHTGRMVGFVGFLTLWLQWMRKVLGTWGRFGMEVVCIFLYEGMKLSMTCRLENWKKNWETARNESILLDFQLLLFGFKMEKLSLLSANCILSISTVWFFLFLKIHRNSQDVWSKLKSIEDWQIYNSLWTCMEYKRRSLNPSFKMQKNI